MVIQRDNQQVLRNHHSDAHKIQLFCSIQCTAVYGFKRNLTKCSFAFFCLRWMNKKFWALSETSAAFQMVC